MELKDFQSAIDNVKARRDEVDRLEKQLAGANVEYQNAVKQVTEMREQFNQELDKKLEGVMPENAQKHVRMS